MNILVINDYAFPAGGIETFVDQIILESPSEFSFRIVTWPPYDPDHVRLPSAPTTRVACGDYAQVLREISWADVLFYQTSWNVRIFGSVLKEYRSGAYKPLVSVIHTSSNSTEDVQCRNLQTRLLKDIVALSDVVVAVSDDVLNSVRPLAPKEHAKFRKIENGSRFNARPINRRAKHTVAYIGRPTKPKGIDVFTQAVRLLANTTLRFCINTVSIPLPQELNLTLAPMGERVTNQYLLSDEAMSEFYRLTDLLVVPYRHSDGLPLVILEALSFGIPILGMNAPGVTDILTRHNQHVLTSHDPQSLAIAIRRWHEGTLEIPTPNPLSVASWAMQTSQYTQIFRKVVL